MKRFNVFFAFVIMLGYTANTAAQSNGSALQKHPDVIDVRVKPNGTNRFDFDVTVSSTYDTAHRYADAFRVTGVDGQVYGERVLLHDHASEQPFTRDLYGVTIPAGIRQIVVQGRDQKYGYGGRSMQVTLPSR
jgi:hypothetical protein